MSMDCTPLGAQTEIDPTNCVSTTATSHFDYAPTGFAPQVIVGAFNVAP